MCFLFRLGLLLVISAELSKGARTWREEPKNVSAHLGETVIIPCAVDADHGQPLNVMWAKNQLFISTNHIIHGKKRYKIVGRQTDGEFNLRIENVTLEDDDVFECQVSPLPGETAPLRKAAHLNVIVPPKSIGLANHRDGAELDVMDGSDVTVTCKAEGGKPAPQLRWFRNGERVDTSSHVTLKETEQSNKLVTAFAELRWKVRPEDHKAIFTCQALHPGLRDPSSLRTNFSLSVTFAPGVPKIVGYSDGQVLTAGEHVQLECLVANGNPKPEVFWYMNGQVLDQEFETEQDNTKNSYGFVVDKKDNLAEYRCVATNKATAKAGLSSFVKLKVHYAPQKVVISGPKSAKLGAQVDLQCSSDESYPPADLRWSIDGKPADQTTAYQWNGDTRGATSISNITISISETEKRDVSVVCTAVNKDLDTAEHRTQHSHTVQVQYPPEPPQILGYNGVPLVEGNSHVLTCNAIGGNPGPELQWLVGHRKRRKNKKKINWMELNEGVVNSATGNMVRSELTFKVNRSDNHAVYKCLVKHPSLDKPLYVNTTLSVYFAPRHVNIHTKPSALKAGQEATLTCDSESGNPPPVITWWKESTEIESTKIHNKSSKYFGYQTKNRINVHLSAADDGSTYTCRAHSPNLAKIIAKSITLDVQYPPQFDLPGPRAVAVLENETLNEDCSASAKPSHLVYSWSRGGERLVRGDNNGLFVWGASLNASSVSRAHAGIYVCQAQNEVGQTNMTLAIKVKYPAEIFRITDEVTVTVGEAADLSCEVRGFPEPKDIVTWSRPNGANLSSTASVTYSDRTSYLRIRDAEPKNEGLYECLASNGVGEPVKRRALLLVQRAPTVTLDRQNLKAAGQLGKSAKLYCKASGVPQVRFYWKLGSQRLENSSKVLITQRQLDHSSFESFMEISDLELEDYTTYECEARNDLGMSQVFVKLTQISRPDPPYNVQVTNETETTVIVTWKPGFDGGMPQKFRVEISKIGQKFEKVASEPAPGSLRLKVTGLESKTRYSFRVGSENDIGPSGFDQSVVASTTGVSSGVSTTAVDDEVPVLLFVIIGLVLVVLLLLNVCLICCFVKRHKRRKLEAANKATTNGRSVKQVTIQSPDQEKAANARLMETNHKPVQMYGMDGMRPESQYTYESDGHLRAYSELSDRDDQSMRTVIEVDSSGQPIYVDHISPATHQTYLLDDPNPVYLPAEYVNDSPMTYAEALRANSLQRRIATGNYQPMPYPEPPASYAGVPAPDYEEQQMVPQAMGPLRSLNEALDQYATPYNRNNAPRARLSPSSSAVPTAVVQTTGSTPYAEVRPIVTTAAASLNNNNSKNGGGSPGSPVLSTFTAPPTRSKVDFLETDQLKGDLV